MGAGRRFVERDARRSHFPRRGPNAPGVRYRGPMARPRPRCLGSESSHWQADLSAYHALALSSSRRRWRGCGLTAFSQSLTRFRTHALRGRGLRLRYADGGTGDTRFTRSVCSLRLGVDLSESVLWVCGESDLIRICMPLHDIRYTIYTDMDTDMGCIRFRGSAEEEEETNALKIHFSRDRPRRTRIQFVLLDSNVRILRKAEKGSEAETSLSLSLSLVKGNNGILAVDFRRCVLLSLFCLYSCVFV